MQASQRNETDDIFQVTFNHPKLVNKILTLHRNSVLIECRSSLSDSSFMYYYENFHFQQKGKRLNENQPICNILNPQINVDVVLDCYTEVTAKYHLIKVNNILSKPKLYKHILIKHQGGLTKIIEHQYEDKIQFDLEKFQMDRMLDFDLNNNMLKKIQKARLQLITFLSLSGFNPPPYSQRLCGDLFYLHVRTLQSQDFHITASPQGFFVNQSKITSFNPQISTTYKTIYINFIDLLRAISDKFRQNLAYVIQEVELTQADVFQVGGRKNRNEWLAQCNYQHTWHNESSMKQMMKISSLGNRQWNQILQMTSQSDAELLVKHRTLIRLYSQFQTVALQGAQSIIDGKISPLNPNDQVKKHIYIFDNIFFSIASETPYDHSQERGDDATPSASSINADLHYLNILENLGIPDLHVLHMIIVSYRGFKVISQCIIPGILSGDQSNCSQYGSIDDGKTIQTNPQFQKIMLQICQKLNLKKRVKLIDGQGQQKIICGNPEIKGIRGSDKRKYILDLARLSPRDLNYIGKEHQFCLIRPKIIEDFTKYKRQKKQHIPQINTNIGTQIEFIPDQEIEKETKFLQEMAEYIIKVAIPNLINALKSNMSSYLSDSKGISEAFHQYGVNIRYLGAVCNHQLLKNDKDIVLCLSKVILARSLKHLFKIAMRQTNILHLNQVITHLLNSIFSKKSVIAQLEEGTYSNELLNEAQSKQAKKKKKKKNKEADKIQQKGVQNVPNVIPPIKIPPSQFLIMKPSQIWAFVRNIAEKRYKFDIGKSIDDNQTLKLPFCKISLLRDLCISTGLVLEKKRYNIIEELEIDDTSLPFATKNIAGLAALVKKKNIQLHPLNQLIAQADEHVQKFQIKQSVQKYNASIQVILSMSQTFQQELSRVYTALGKISYIMGDYTECVRCQLTSCHILENLQALDDRKTIQSYSTLGLYYSAKGQASKSAYYLYKSIFLMLMSFGEIYPDFFVSISNLTRLYNNCKQYAKAQNIHLRAIKIINSACGKYHFKTTFFYAALANICYETGDLKKAIFYQTQCVSILMAVLPENDIRLLDAKKILKVYRQLNISKTLNQQPQQQQKIEQVPAVNTRVNSRQKKR